LPIIPLDIPDDPRLSPYTLMKDRDLSREGNRFIAEGLHVVERLLASKFSCESVLTSPRLLDKLQARVHDKIPLYVVPKSVIDQVVGYRFHNGALAVGVKGEAPTLDSVLAPTVVHTSARRLIVVAPELNSTENLGSILRICAGLGAAALVIGPKSADPFYRQSIRVSMGAAFTVPIVLSKDIVSDLKRLSREFGFDTLASVLRDDAVPLDQFTPTRSCAIVLGSEAHGLSDAEINACSHRLTIPMHLGTDSLNVAIACALFAWHVTRK